MPTRELQTDAVRAALARMGWTQKDLAEALDVSAQSITNWLKGSDFPRPEKLLRLATALGLRLAELTKPLRLVSDAPVVAFRRRAGTKTTDTHIVRALAMGAMLEPLVAYVPELRALRTELPNPSRQYEALQRAALQVRRKIGIGESAVLDYSALISEFANNDAIIVPVLWGQKQRHENALHIFLPKPRVTFIYLNLDTRIEDFKFWMAHELGHVYTPGLTGTEDGEDFADAFAGALLFPEVLAREVYERVCGLNSKGAALRVMSQAASDHYISLFTVFCEVRAYARARSRAELAVREKDIHVARVSGRGPLVSQLLFDPLPPSPAAYVAASSNVFRSEFFPTLRKMLRESGTGASYLQQVMDISHQDAVALHAALSS